jgi:hypothetical protein
VAALLHGEQERAAVRRPLRRTLTVVDTAADLAPIRAIGVHHPHVGVLHRRLAIGEAALRRLERDHPAVGRPARAVLVAFRGHETANRPVGQLQREDVVVEELIVVGIPIGEKEQLLAVRRPVNRMLVVVAVGQLFDPPGCEVGDEQMQPAVVVEVGQPLGGIRFVQIAGDHDRVAGGVRCFGTWHGCDECDAPRVR